MRFERLKNILSISKGRKPLLTSEPNSGSIRFLQIGDLRNDNNLKYTNEKNGVIATKDDILLAWDGANAGTVGYGKEGFIGSTIAVLRKKEPARFSTAFIGKFLQSQFNYLRNNATGATIPHIDRKSLEDLKIPVLEIDHQIQIANVLNRAESLINQRKESIHLLDEFLKSIFFEMFFSESIKRSQPVTIESLAKKDKGSMRTGPFGSDLLHSEFSSTGYARVLGIDNVVNNVFESGEARFITQDKFEKLKRYKVCPGDVLVTIMGTTGRTAVVPKDIPLSINTKHLAALTFDQQRANPIFISYSLRNNPYVIKQLKDRTRGAIMDGLNLGIIKSLQIECPPIALQNQFAHIIEKTQALKAQFQTSLEELENLYGSLSQRAFNGELQFKLDAKVVVSLQTNDKEEDYFKKRKALACYIINQSLDDNKFGDTKFEKLLFLSDYDAIKRNFGQHYYQKVAGPYDNTFTNTFYNQIENSKLFKRKRSEGQTIFQAGTNHNKSFTASDYFSKQELERVNRLVNIFKKSDYEKPEIIATLYAVWNNRIIRQQQISYELLKEDFLKWDAMKAKYKGRLDAALAWMRKENIVPDGWGKIIERPKGKKFNENT
jgi:type I restriction enzyme S subunit